MTGAASERDTEEPAALGALAAGAALEMRVLGLPDGYLPEHWAEVKLALGDLAASGSSRSRCSPRIDTTRTRDHRLLGELTPTAFRDRLILGYEILKWESDLPSTTIYQPLPRSRRPPRSNWSRCSNPSQAGHDWFDREAFSRIDARSRSAGPGALRGGIVAEKLTLAAR